MKFIFSRSKKIAKIDCSKIVKDAPEISLGFFLAVVIINVCFICSHVIGILTDRKVMQIDQNELSSVLCDAYDIKDRLKTFDLMTTSKDSDNSETTLGDCIYDIIDFLENLEERINKND